MCGEKKAKKIARGERSYRSKLALLTASSLLSMPLLAADQLDDKSVRQFKKVTVSATRMEADIDDVARSITVIKKEEIA